MHRRPRTIGVLTLVLSAAVVITRARADEFTAGKTWKPLKVPGTGYYPRSVQAADGRIFVFGHVGGDDAYGKVDQSIVMDSFLTLALSDNGVGCRQTVRRRTVSRGSACSWTRQSSALNSGESSYGLMIPYHTAYASISRTTSPYGTSGTGRLRRSLSVVCGSMPSRW